MPAQSFIVRSVSWADPLVASVKDIRVRVFVQEQKVPIAEEFDRHDPSAYHVLVFDAGGVPMGTGRLFADANDASLAHIGRMAVLPEGRGRGFGAAIMKELMAESVRRGFARIILSAQQHAVGFYARFGFHPSGELYMDVDIPHIDMMKILEGAAGSNEHEQQGAGQKAADVDKQGIDEKGKSHADDEQGI